MVMICDANQVGLIFEDCVLKGFMGGYYYQWQSLAFLIPIVIIVLIAILLIIYDVKKSTAKKPAGDEK